MIHASHRALPGTAALAAMALISACGGGGGGSDGLKPSPVTATVTGRVVKGPVRGAHVCAYAIAGGAQAENRGCTSTDEQGDYTLVVNADGAPLIFAVRGDYGTYTDELTGGEHTLGARLRSAQTVSPGGTATVMITPLTEVAIRRALGARGGLGDTSINDAMTLVARAFDSGDLRRERPTDLTLPTSVQASLPNLKYGLALAAVSAMTQGSSLDAVLSDLSDKGFKPDLVAGAAAAYESGLRAFVGSTRNKSAVTLGNLSAFVQPSLATMSQAFGVLPTVPSEGGAIVTPPVQPSDGPACVVTMNTEPGNIASGNWRVCLRKVAASACTAGAQATVVAGVSAFGVLQSLGPTSIDYTSADTCTAPDINEIIEIGN